MRQRLATGLPRARGAQQRLRVLLVQTILAVTSCLSAVQVRAESESVAAVAPAAPDTTEPLRTALLPRRSVATIAVLRVVQGEVELSLSAPVESSRQYLRGDAERAERCYIDLLPASFSARAHSVFDLPTGPIRKIRISQFRAGIVRVVLDLRGAQECAVTALTEPRRLRVSVGRAQGLSESSGPPFPKRRDKAVALVSPRNNVLRRQESDEHPHVVETMQKQEQAKSEELLSPIAWRTRTRSWTMLKIAPPAHLSGESNLAASAFMSASEAAAHGDSPSEANAVEPARTQLTEPQTVTAPELREPVFFSQELTRELNRTGGVVVQQFWMIMMGASIVLAFLSGGGVMFLWNLRKYKAPPEKSDGWEARMAYLEEAVNRAGMLNSSFFHSLDITQKRLEAVLTHADLAEQNLRRLLHQSALSGEQPTGRSTDSYATAALLLAEGEGVQQVARVLKLPVAQVRVLQELRQATQGEKSAGSQEKVAETQHERNFVAGLKGFVPQLNGAPRDGTPLAHNGQTL